MTDNLLGRFDGEALLCSTLSSWSSGEGAQEGGTVAGWSPTE